MRVVSPHSPLPGILNVKSLNLMAGASGIGKTAFIAGLARRFTDSAAVFGHTPQPLAGLGYITADRYWDDSQEWFAKVDLPDITQYSLVDDPATSGDVFSNPFGGPALLLKCVEQLHLPPQSLIFVDPIANFLGGNLMDYRAVSRGCINIRKWLALPTNQHCLVGICHTAKLKGNKQDRYVRPQDRIMGTSGLLAFTDTQMYLMSPEEAERARYVFLWNPHHHPEETFELEKDPTTGLFKLDHTPAQLTKPVPVLENLDADLQTLYALLPPPPATLMTAAIHTLLRDLGIAPVTIWRRLKRLETAGFIVHDGHGRWGRK